MEIIIGILVMYIVAVAIGTGLCKLAMPKDTSNKHLKVMLIGFGIVFAVLGVLINIAFKFV